MPRSLRPVRLLAAALLAGSCARGAAPAPSGPPAFVITETLPGGQPWRYARAVAAAGSGHESPRLGRYQVQAPVLC